VAKYYFFPRELAKRQPRLIGLGWRLEAALIRSLMWLLARLPLERAAALARAVFGTLGPFTQTARRVRRNLTVAFPERNAQERQQLVREIFGNLGVTLAELAQLDRIWAEWPQRVEIVVSPDVEFLRHAGRPAVLVSAHVSAYTLTNFVAGVYDFPLTTVYLPESNPYIRDLILRLYSALPVQMKPRDSSMRTLIGELAHGRTVGLASDVRLDSGEPLPFFGHDMAANTVPARLALRYRCELVPARAERLPGGRFRITIYAPIRPEDPSASEAEQARNMTVQLMRHYESWIRANPGEWMCLARRWSKDIERAAEQAVLQKPS
jgi:Kdo2-lipid IVA lauroyltransferase/acyltransferase